MYGFTKRQLTAKVWVKCGRKEEKMTRGEALKLFREGMMYCDGSEQERYATIFSQLLEGRRVVTDELY